MKNLKDFKNSFKCVALFSMAISLFGCASWRSQKAENLESMVESGGTSNIDPAVRTLPTDTEKLEHLSQALSKSQIRIEELEAKINVLQETLDHTKTAIDNLNGTKELPLEPLGNNSDQLKTEEPQTLQAKKLEEKETQVAKTEKSDVLIQDPVAQDFSRGMNLFKKKAFTDAIIEFQKFSEKNPDHILAGSARFYIGESYYSMGQYKLALSEYQAVIKNFEKSPRVPSALVRISHCLSIMGNNKESSKFLALAEENYPGNPSLQWPAPEIKAKAPPSPHSEAEVNAEKTDDLPVAPMSPPETSYPLFGEDAPC